MIRQVLNRSFPASDGKVSGTFVLLIIIKKDLVKSFISNQILTSLLRTYSTEK